MTKFKNIYQLMELEKGHPMAYSPTIITSLHEWLSTFEGITSDLSELY
jgi:hypothetical protein